MGKPPASSLQITERKEAACTAEGRLAPEGWLVHGLAPLNLLARLLHPGDMQRWMGGGLRKSKQAKAQASRRTTPQRSRSRSKKQPGLPPPSSDSQTPGNTGKTDCTQPLSIPEHQEPQVSTFEQKQESPGQKPSLQPGKLASLFTASDDLQMLHGGKNAPATHYSIFNKSRSTLGKAASSRQSTSLDLAMILGS